eukprot:3980114-Pyramimonas_sp.AAC.1
MSPKRVHSIGFFKSLLDKDLKTASASMAKVTLVHRPHNSMAPHGARAESQSWGNSPPNNGLLQVSLLSSLGGLASGETCSAHQSNE